MKTDAIDIKGGSPPKTPENTKETPTKSSSTSCQSATTEHHQPSASPNDEGTTTAKTDNNKQAKATAKQKQKQKQAKANDKKKRIEKEIFNKKRVTRGAVIKGGAVEYQRCMEAIGVRHANNLYRGAQISYNGGNTFVDIEDTSEANVYLKVQEGCYIYDPDNELSRYQTVRTSVSDRLAAIHDQLHNNRINPLKDWFDTLEKHKHPVDLIGLVFTPRFTEDLREIIRTELQVVNELDIDKLIVQFCIDWVELCGKGLYLRTLYPGSSFQYLPTMVGPQGCGKGTFIRSLLPAFLKELIGEGLNIKSSTADLLENCQKHAIIECSELEGYGRSSADMASLKSFIGGERTSARKAYGRFFLTYMRHHIIIATNNNSDFLAKDPTGDRRWPILPVDFKEGWDKTTVKNNMSKMMAAAMEKFWGRIKYLVEDLGQDASYESWASSSKSLREIICRRHEKRPRTLEAALVSLIDPVVGEFDDSPRLTPTEKTKGIFFDVPPSCSSERSIMNVLPTKITSIYSEDMISKVMKEQGWTTGKKRTIPGTNLRRHVKIPPMTILPEKTEHDGCYSDPKSPNAQATKPPRPPQLPPMTTQAEDEAKLAQSFKDLDNLYLKQKGITAH